MSPNSEQTGRKDEKIASSETGATNAVREDLADATQWSGAETLVRIRVGRIRNIAKSAGE